MLRGASIPLGEDSCKVRIGLRDTVQHGSARHILEETETETRAKRSHPRDKGASSRLRLERRPDMVLVLEGDLLGILEVSLAAVKWSPRVGGTARVWQPATLLLCRYHSGDERCL